MPSNETALKIPDGITVAVDIAIQRQEALGHSRADIQQQPMFGEIIDSIMERLVLKPDTSESRHIAKLHVITELGSRK
jgi:hypothetical protein